MRHTLVVATKNRGKLHELGLLLEGLPIDLVAYGDVLPRPLEVDEDGETFQENAVKKATVIAHAAMSYGAVGTWVYEDDSLGGPGKAIIGTTVGLGAMFGLGLFFFIAGRLTSAAHARLAPRAYVKKRLRRLAPPTGSAPFPPPARWAASADLSPAFAA